MDERALLDRLHELLSESAARFGQTIDRIDEMHPDLEVHRVGRTGVLAFVGDYVLTGWPDDEMRIAGRDAYKLLQARLDERGMTRHMVYPLNFRSVKLTRKLGAKPVGVDADGYVHYTLTREEFCRHG